MAKEGAEEVGAELLPSHIVGVVVGHSEVVKLVHLEQGVESHIELGAEFEQTVLVP